MIVALALLGSQAVPPDTGLRRASPLIEAALAHALNFDSSAYQQVCDNADRKLRLRLIQRRARYLGEMYQSKFMPPDVIFMNYVDRRPAGRCVHPERFDATLNAWREALDEIGAMVGKEG
jgi:hypothetical protein